MDIEDQKVKGYLDELYRQTDGNLEAQVSMHELGASIGLEKAEASSLAEQLMVQGLAELRTLAGGISITSEGLAVLGITPPVSDDGENGCQLSAGPIADETDRRTIQLLADEIKNSISALQLDYEVLEEIVMDVKTIEVQMLSPKPKVGVMVETFRSLHKTLEAVDALKISAKIGSIIT